MCLTVVHYREYIIGPSATRVGEHAAGVCAAPGCTPLEALVWFKGTYF